LSGEGLVISRSNFSFEELLPSDIAATRLEVDGGSERSVNMDATESWPMTDGSRDWITCLQLLHVARQPDFVLAEIGRILKPGGTAVISVPFLSPAGAVWEQDDLRLTLGGLTRRLPGSLVRQEGLLQGGLGTVIGELLLDWGRRRSAAMRLSPVILEIPLLPLMLILRGLCNLSVNVFGVLLDQLDREQRYYLNSVVVLRKRERAPLNAVIPEK
jgi:SAM-dependent methyltransferase